MRKITVEMACSINGLIATEHGNEDFLSYRGWEIMLEFLKEYDVLIWGRKTWENIVSWGYFSPEVRSVPCRWRDNATAARTQLLLVRGDF